MMILATLDRFLNQKRSFHRAIISDILLWLLILVLCSLGIFWLLVTLPAKQGQSIILPFKETNEISPGSPVRMMGVDVGSVDSVRFQRDHVDVKIQLYPGVPTVPSGAVFNILFTGLAGAKNIEIELPEHPILLKPGEKPIYHVEDPIRLQEALNAVITETQDLQQGAESLGDFLDAKAPIEKIRVNLYEGYAMSGMLVNRLNQLNQATGRLQGKLVYSVDSLSKLLDRWTPSQTHSIFKVTSPTIRHWQDNRSSSAK